MRALLVGSRRSSQQAIATVAGYHVGTRFALVSNLGRAAEPRDSGRTQRRHES